LEGLEQRVGAHDTVIMELVQTIRKMMEPEPIKPKRRIGF